VKGKLKRGGNVAAAKEVGGPGLERGEAEGHREGASSTAAASSTTAASRPSPTRREAGLKF
jgi:hypothetical protein